MPSRADLQFTELHEPLTQPERVEDPAIRKPVEAVPAPTSIFRSLQRPAREMLTSITLRVPVSMAERLERVCTKRKVDRSELIRDFIEAGLDIVEGSRG